MINILIRLFPNNKNKKKRKEKSFPKKIYTINWSADIIELILLLVQRLTGGMSLFK